MHSFEKHIKPSVRALNVYAVKGRPMSTDLIKLNQNENPFDLPDELKRELMEEFFAIHWNRYPEVVPVQLLQALSAWLGTPVEGIIAANGSNELMYTVLMAIVGKGTNVVIPSPTFFLYEKIVHVLEGTVVSVPMRADLSFDIDGIVAAAKRTAAALVVMNSPNSPTGRSAPVEDIERLLRETDSIVLVDEAYIEFSDRPSVAPLLERYDRLIVLRTFSKAFSLAGLRVGYLMAHPALCAEIMKPKIPFTVNNLSQCVAVTLLRHPDIVQERIAEVKRQKQRLFESMRGIAEISVFPSDTNFLIFQPTSDAATLFDRLLAEHVLIRDVSSYPMLNNTLRVNAGTEAENTAFLTALHKFL